MNQQVSFDNPHLLDEGYHQDAPSEELVGHSRTTLMVRNIPILYTSELLLAEWPNHGSYDFLHLPYCTVTNRNLSYAFINFTSPEEALLFTERWHKRRLQHYTSQKPLNISFAVVQGLEANVKLFRKKMTARNHANQSQPHIFHQRGPRPVTQDVQARRDLPARGTSLSSIIASVPLPSHDDPVAPSPTNDTGGSSSDDNGSSSRPFANFSTGGSASRSCKTTGSSSASSSNSWMQSRYTRTSDSSDQSQDDGEARKMRTTLMVWNIPRHYTPEMLMVEWPNNGTYDFLCLPYDPEKKSNDTYAFVNFVSPAEAEAFAKRWNLQRMAHGDATNQLNIAYAAVQGFEDNMKFFRKKTVARSDERSSVTFGHNNTGAPPHRDVAAGGIQVGNGLDGKDRYARQQQRSRDASAVDPWLYQ